VSDIIRAILEANKLIVKLEWEVIKRAIESKVV